MPTVISRADARAKGLRLYFTGKPCKRGHVAERIVRDAVCRACELERHARYHDANRDRQLERMRRNNAERRPAINRAMRANYAANPDRYGARDSARRAAEVAAMPDDFGEFDEFVIAEAYAACRRRRAMTGYAWHVDHMVPLSRGGAHAWHNVQVIPAWLNLWKRNRRVLTRPGEWVVHLPGSGA